MSIPLTRELFPVFLKLAGRRVLVVGAGPVAASKIGALVATGAEIHVVAPDVHPDIAAAPVTRHVREFADSDLDGAWFVVAAAAPAVNRQVARAAESRGVFVNAVDDPPNASAYLGGVLRRAGVTLAISTDGRAPALAGLLREGLDAVLPADLDRWVTQAAAIRRAWVAGAVPMDERRPLLLRALNALYAARQQVAVNPAAAGSHARGNPVDAGADVDAAVGPEARLAVEAGSDIGGEVRR